MIHEVRIENFFSIRDEQVLDLRVPGNAPKLDRFRPAPSRPSTRLPTVVALYGPNASGKSTVLRTLSATIDFALNSFDSFSEDDEIYYFQPFGWQSSQLKPTKIWLEFDAPWLDKGQLKLFQYELHLNNIGSPFGSKDVLYEALRFSPEGKMRRVFERKGQKFTVSKKNFGLLEKDMRLQAIRPNASVVSTLAKFNHRESADIRAGLARVQSNIQGLFKVESAGKQLLQAYKEDDGLLEELNRELRRFDVGLESMSLAEGNNGLFAYFAHTGLDGYLLMPDESRGTQRFIEIFPRLHYVLKFGGIAVIDELDTDLHPLLIPELLRWFQDPIRNPKSAQLWFTAHNASLMNELEKEEIFFTEKDASGGTQVYGARDIEGLRREPSLEKKYLGGVLGAVPHIG